MKAYLTLLIKEVRSRKTKLAQKLNNKKKFNQEILIFKRGKNSLFFEYYLLFSE